MKLMDAPIHTFCASNNITGYLPYKIRAITTSTRSSRPKEVSAITLQHGSAEPWSRVLELIELNYSNGTKEHVVIIDSDWTNDGRAPPSVEVSTQEPDASQSQGKRTQRSINQFASYQADRGVFWNDIKSYWVCNDPLHCKVKARNGIACWIHKARHYEIGYNLAPAWREALEREGGSTRHPPKSIRRVIKDFDNLSAQRDARKQADLKGKASVPQQASPSVSQFFYVGSQGPPLPTTPAQPSLPRHKSSSPIPADLDNGEGWVSFWDSIKASIRSSRPEAWQAGLDRAMAALDADFWTLSMLFKATDATLEKVVPQTGLRMLIHQHLSKFISSHRESAAGPPRVPNFGGASPRFGSPPRFGSRR